MTGETFYDPEFADTHHGEWTCHACGAPNSQLDGDCQFCDGEAGPLEEPDGCEECDGRGKVVYDDVAEGPIPCRACNGRGF
jgi:DnaJ-class molecular chaperone